MKNSNEKKDPTIKQVFSDVENNFQGSSKYPLGEDFYTFDTGDTVAKINGISKIIIPDISN